jgi:hypothetical protein
LGWGYALVLDTRRSARNPREAYRSSRFLKNLNEIILTNTIMHVIFFIDDEFLWR